MMQPHSRAAGSDLLSDLNRQGSTRTALVPSDDSRHDRTKAPIVERQLAIRFVGPVVRWCAAVLDRDHRRHDHRRPVRFWGDE